MLLPSRSKSVRSTLNSGTAKCDSCEIITEYFVAILHSEKPALYHYICLDCYEKDTWQTRISKKAAIMNDGLSSGSQKSESKPSVSLSRDRSEGNGQVTSTSHWWDKI